MTLFGKLREAISGRVGGVSGDGSVFHQSLSHKNFKLGSNQAVVTEDTRKWLNL